MTNAYDDIIHLPHHVSRRRPQMSRLNRAAQFAPFAALTGYEEAVEEMARLTQRQRELDEDEKALLDERLRQLAASAPLRPYVVITCFEADEHKAGGAYITVTGRVRQVDGCARAISMTDGRRIPFSALHSLEGELFQREAEEA